MAIHKLEFKTKPFPHQRECYDRFKHAPYAAIFADMGTGKSKMAIDIIVSKYIHGVHDRLVIIAPIAVGQQWHNEQLNQHCGVPFQSYVYRSGTLVKDKRAQAKFFADCKCNEDLQVFIINFEAFVKGKGNDLVKIFCGTSKKAPAFVIDEASRIKNPEAKSVKNIMRLRRTYPNSFRLVMTGTPAAKSPVDMWSIFEFLKESYFGCSYMAFQHEHEILFDRKMEIRDKIVTVRTGIDIRIETNIRKWIGRASGDPDLKRKICRKFGLSGTDYDIIASTKDFVRFKNVNKLQAKIAPDTFSVSKNDCLDLPEKIYQVVQLEMNAEQKKQIKQLAAYSATTYQGEVLTITTKALLGTRVLQICGGNLAVNTTKEGKFDTVQIKGVNQKLNYIINDLEEAGGAQAIVWAVFVPEIELLHFEIGKKFSVAAMHGETPKSDRLEAVERFKSGDAQVLVCNPDVGGYGLNLQGAGIQYWYSRWFRTEARLQAEDRSHRIGTVKSPIYKDLLYNSKFERNVMEVLKAGADMNATFVTTDLNDIFALD